MRKKIFFVALAALLLTSCTIVEDRGLTYPSPTSVPLITLGTTTSVTVVNNTVHQLLVYRFLGTEAKIVGEVDPGKAVSVSVNRPLKIRGWRSEIVITATALNNKRERIGTTSKKFRLSNRNQAYLWEISRPRAPGMVR